MPPLVSTEVIASLMGSKPVLPGWLSRPVESAVLDSSAILALMITPGCILAAKWSWFKASGSAL